MSESTRKVAIITGAASGIGLLTAQRFAASGMAVVLTDVNLEAVATATHNITEQGWEATYEIVDVRDYTAVKAAVYKTVQRYGRIDIVVNNAGGSSGRVFGRTETFKDLPIEILDWGIDVNLKGPMYFAHAAIGYMMEQRSGVILNIGSIDGQVGSPAVDYSAAKSGVMNGLTKSLALYGAEYGVRVCCLSPGPVLTRPNMAKMRTPLGRAAEPHEIVDMIEYLCSDKAKFITGSNYMIDGGRSCGAQNY